MCLLVLRFLTVCTASSAKFFHHHSVSSDVHQACCETYVPTVCWCFRYNSQTRTLENLVLQQGLDLPVMAMSSDEPLPPPRTLLDEPLTVGGDKHSYSLPPDTSGEATRLQCRRPKTDPVWQPLVAKTDLPADISVTGTAVLTAPEPVSFSVTATDLSVATIPAVEVPTAGLPKNTVWRHRRNLEWGITPVYQKRKAYTCRKCGQPSTAATGHSKHWAFTYCPNLGKQGRSGWQKLKIAFS